MKDQIFLIVGKLATALILIMAFLLICSFVGNQAIKASDRAEQGERFQTQTHKAENFINRAKE